jgi:hypothetical protein
MWWQAIHTVLWGFLLLIGCKILIRHGGLGLALSYLGAYILFTALQFGTQALVINKLGKETY